MKKLKENCISKINDDQINLFSYSYKFQKKGKFKLEYTFENNIQNVAYMFYNCNSLIYVDLSNFNTKNVTNMSYMFYECNSLKKINLSNFNSINVTNMSYMFYKCSSLENLDLSKLNTKNVTNALNIFEGCERIYTTNN